MKKSIFIVLALFFIANSAFAGDFISQFLNKCVENERPVSNVNIGKTMLKRMTTLTNDESLKNAFQELNNIRIITTDNKKDSKYYFKKANELATEEFADYQEVVSLNESKNKMCILMKNPNEKSQDIILISLDDNNSLAIITVSGKMDLASLSKLSNTLEGQNIPQNESDDSANKNN